MIKFIVFDSGSSASKLMFNDLLTVNNCLVTSEIYAIKNRFLKTINRLHTSQKINRYIKLPFKSIWEKYIPLESIYNENDIYVLIFTNISIRKISLSYLESIKKRPNVFIVLVCVDSFVDKKLSPLSIMGSFKFDLVYSFDSKDAEDYHLNHTISLYSKKKYIGTSSIKSDIFWIGRAKDRLDSIIELAERLNKANLKPSFYILDVPNSDRKPVEGITYIDSVIKYDSVLDMIQNTHCLLDIVQKGQCGMTMRVFESIFYNKKLITNNINVAKIDFYSNDKIQIFNNIDDIDINFIDSKTKIDFHYDGRYSPVKFLERVLTDLSLSEGDSNYD